MDQEVDQAIVTTEPPVKHDIRWVFFGGDGLLRAGWGVLCFVALLVGFEFLTGAILRHFLPPHNRLMGVMPLKLGLMTEIVQFIPVVIATAIMALIERRPFLAYGFLGEARVVRFLAGLGCGFIALSALVGALWKTGLLVFDGQTLHGGAIWKYGLAWAVVFVIVGFFEESALRGYLQYTLSRGIGFWWGALLLSFLFGFSHGTNPGETPVGLFAAGAVGLVFCLSLWYTGSLWWAIGCHASWDWAESYFYGTSDSGLISEGRLFSEHPTGPLLWSGGTTGPEGSLLVLALLAIMALLMWIWWGRRVTSPFIGSGWRPAWSRKPSSLQTEDLAA